MLKDRSELLGLGAAQRREISRPNGEPLGDGMAKQAESDVRLQRVYREW